MDMSVFSSLRSARVSRLLLAGLIILSAPTQAADLHLQINGSNTIGAELAPRLVEGMLLANDASDIRADLNQTTREHRITAVSVDGHSIEVRIHAHGSGTAFKGLKDGSAQIGAASRPIRQAEASDLAAGDMLSADAEQVIGLDGIAVIVHPDNPIQTLDLDQIAQVFAGQITDWRELGGLLGPVHIHARDGHPGTWETFRDMVLSPRQLELATSAQRYASTSELSLSVRRDIGAIGFVGLSGIAPSRALAVTSGDSQPMQPTAEPITTEGYPLARRPFMYIRPTEPN